MPNLSAQAPEIDDYLGEAVARGDVPYVVAGVTDRFGRAQYFCKGRDAVTGHAVSPRTVFWIASMTKALTSVAALQLVEQGLLDLDAPIGTVLPQLARRDVLEGFDAEGRPMLRPAAGTVTLAQLLSHTSGFGEGAWSARILRYLEASGTPPTSTARLAALDLPLLFDPGTAWHYGIGHDWVGQAIEAASGRRLDRYFAEELFAPLGMTDTVYDPGPERQARMVTVHRRGADGTLTPIDRRTPTDREFLSGGGTMFSTAPDYLAFLAMLMNGGRYRGVRVLEVPTVARMAADQTGDLPVSWVEPAQPEASNKAEFLAGYRKCWGLGTMVNLEDLRTGRRAGSFAWGGLGNTYFWADPVGGLGGVVMTQILPFADPRVLDLFEDFETACYYRFG